MTTAPTIPEQQVRWTVVHAILLLVGTQVLAVFWAAALYDPAEDWPPPIARLVLGTAALWVGYGGGSLLVSWLRGNGPRPDYGARIALIDVPIGLAAGVGTQLVLVPLLYLPLNALFDLDSGESARSLIERVDGPLDVALLTLSAAIMAPLVEELFFRGLFLRSLGAVMPAWGAVVVSSVVFALVHVTPAVLPGLFLFGVVAALLVYRTGRLGSAWVMHVAFNATTLISLGLYS
ncbi:MAG: CPBP family intramembrane glutamic endopeptidase [Actinomycetota bacterium]